MQIHYLGHACFLIESDKGTRIVTDPYPQSILPHSCPQAEAVTVSHHHFDHDAVSTLPGNPRVIEGEGSFTLQDITVTGYPSFHDNKQGALRGRNTVFIFEVEGLRIAHLGDLGQQPGPALKEALSKLDLLLIPIGGTYTLDGREAAALAKTLQPKCVVPMHYALPGYSMNISDETPFLEAMGDSRVISLPGLSTPLPEGIVLLEPR